MRIYEMTTNRIVHPLGFRFDAVRLGYKVEDAPAPKQEAARIEISTCPDFCSLAYDSGRREDIDSLCFVPEMALAPYTRYYWRVTVFAGGQEATGAAWFETARENEPWTARWITPDADYKNAVMLKRFTLDKEVARARAYVCGLGLYELRLNGAKAGDEYLTPDCNAYDKWLQYQTYDVGELLKSGENEICVPLGDGWYKGRFGFQTNEGNTYGDKQALIMELRLEYADGSVEVISTDTDWTCRESKVRFANIYDGEVYDATFAPAGEKPVKEIDLGYDKLSARLSLPVKVMECLKPARVIHTPAGETVIDLGQEITGWLEFKTRAPRGTELKLYYGEILQHDNFYNENLRTAKAEYTYIADGNEAVVRPIFTFFGFRFIKLVGFGEEIDLNDFTGCAVYSDMPVLMALETANPKVNRLWLNALWGQKSNYLDVPTDCPQRDERMGWTGDAQAFSGTACFNMEVAAFLQKYIYDMRMEQDKFDGSVPHVIPSFEMGPGGSCAWADAATIVPWNLYLFFGDKELLREQYSTMRDWVEYIYRQDEKSGGARLWRVGFHFADWLALDTENGSPMGGTDTYLVASAFYYYSTTLTLKAARALGYAEDVVRYEKLAAEILAALQNEYFTPGGRLGESTQTAYILALFMRFAPEKHIGKIAALLKNKFRNSDEKLRTGFVGTSYLNRVLSGFGMNELAYKLLLNEEYPGWLYEVNMGATTVWERWNSVLPNGLISDVSMNSLNHYAYGAVMEWVYRDVAGLNPVEGCPGFREALIRPRPNFRMPKVSLAYESAVGKYEIMWEIRADKTFTMRVTIPFGATAKCVLPYGDIEALAKQHPGLAFAQEGEDAAATLTMGRYVFLYKPTKPLHRVLSLDTPFGVLRADKEVWGALTEALPALKEGRAYQLRDDTTLRGLADSPFLHIPEDTVALVEAVLNRFN